MAILKEFIEIYLNINGYFTGLRITIVVFKLYNGYAFKCRVHV